MIPPVIDIPVIDVCERQLPNGPLYDLVSLLLADLVSIQKEELGSTRPGPERAELALLAYAATSRRDQPAG